MVGYAFDDKPRVAEDGLAEWGMEEDGWKDSIVARKSFACFAVVVMIITTFATLSGSAKADVQTVSARSAVSSLAAPGTNVTTLANGQVEVQNLANFRRWDGVWGAVSGLNRSSGNWPYQVTETNTSFAVSLDGYSFTQGKVAGASYNFETDRIKELIAINQSFPTPVVSASIFVPLATSYSVQANGSTVSLLDSNGHPAWRTAPFLAWDSAAPSNKWSSAVTSIQLVEGGLNLSLDTDMAASAIYPLYVDPTWVIGGASGWGASTFQNATKDYGDGNVKIGWLADNFNDNVNEVWVTSGVTFSGGTMNLATAGYAYDGDSWSNLNAQFDVYFSSYQSGSDWLDFYVGEACPTTCTAFDLQILQSSNQVKLIDPLGSTFASFSQTMATGTWYTVRLSAQGTTYQVWWNGVLKVTGTDSFGRATAGIKFRTTTPSTVKVDNVRVWNTNSGSITTPVRDAGTSNRPLQSEIFGSVDSFKPDPPADPELGQ